MYYVKTSDNTNIAVHDIAPYNNKVAVMVHGWPLDSRLFEYQTNILPLYGYRVVLIDLRGFGKSDRPYDGYSYNRLAEDLYDVIKKLNLSNFTLAGFSMGGAIVSRYMKNYNGYGVKKLALISAAVPHFTKNDEYPHAAYSVEEVNDLVYKLLHDRPNALDEFGKNFFFKPKSIPLMTWFNNMTVSESSYGTIETLISLRDEDLTEDLKSIKIQTTIFHGAHDLICPLQLAQRTSELVKNSNMIVFDESGHGLFLDQLDKFNQEFLDFLN